MWESLYIYEGRDEIRNIRGRLEELRQIQNDENKEYSYEFENIDDEISEEPNREEYELIGKKFWIHY